MDVTWAATDDAWTAARRRACSTAPRPPTWSTSWTRCCRGATTRPSPTRGVGHRRDRAAGCAARRRDRDHALAPRPAAHPARPHPARAGRPARALPRRLLPRPPARHLPGGPRAAAELRRILAPYELLFDGLDAELAALPDGIDPATADDDPHRSPAELAGVPAAGRPVGRDPVGAADAGRGPARPARHAPRPAAAARPGDRSPGHRDRRRRRARGAGSWAPARAPSVGAAPARLGVDTLEPRAAACARPRREDGPRRDPLGPGCPDPELMLAERAATVTVTVEVDPVQRRELQPVIDRLLPAFVPAHCRLQVIYTAADAADRSRRLDVDFRLETRRRCTATCTGASAPRPGPAGGRCPRRRTAPSYSTTTPRSTAHSDCTSDEGANMPHEEPGGRSVWSSRPVFRPRQMLTAHQLNEGSRTR